MELEELQQIHLRNVIEWAKKLRADLHPLFEPPQGEVHFRPTSSGVSMISLDPGSPQMGKSGFRDLAALRDNFETLYAKHCVGKGPGRRTGEKMLQSSLISEAYLNHRRLVSINAACAQAGKPTNLLFATDEISLPLGPKSHIVCDLLGLKAVSEDQYTPVVMELKSSRMFKKLARQVTQYAKRVDEHWGLFEELFSVLLDREIRLSGQCERWIVWPMADEHIDTPNFDFARKGIKVVGYKKESGEFAFEIA